MNDRPQPGETGARREVAARKAGWARVAAARLADAGIKPNWISWLSVVFAGGAGTCLVLAGRSDAEPASALVVLSVMLIACRLLCNLFDGMVAVEGGLGTKSGEIFNDLPDRISDPIIIVCAGYAIRDLRFGIELGWLAGLLSVLTAYARMLAGATGATQVFLGPMAKQHRMAVLTAALLAFAVAARWTCHGYIVAVALGVIALGCAITIARRVAAAVRELESQ